MKRVFFLILAILPLVSEAQTSQTAAQKVLGQRFISLTEARHLDRSIPKDLKIPFPADTLSKYRNQGWLLPIWKIDHFEYTFFLPLFANKAYAQLHRLDTLGARRLNYTLKMLNKLRPEFPGQLGAEPAKPFKYFFRSRTASYRTGTKLVLAYEQGQEAAIALPAEVELGVVREIADFKAIFYLNEDKNEADYERVPKDFPVAHNESILIMTGFYLKP